MQRFHQLLFVVSLLALSWLAMMAVHELGHVVGAFVTRARVVRVVLHPLTISRTDVDPNPHPSLVVWLGPIVGCLLPVVGWFLIPHRLSMARRSAMFFAGFCLIANGAYIGLGSFDGVGDCREMLKTGSPHWALIAFGVMAATLGFFVWHKLGSVKQFMADPSMINASSARLVLVILVLVIACEVALF